MRKKPKKKRPLNPFKMEVMKNYFILIIFSTVFLFSGCFNVPSTEDIDSDLNVINKEIEAASQKVQEYSGGLLAVLRNVRLETLKTTKSMLEQKKMGYRRFIPLSYSIDGKGYNPPGNKDVLLQELEGDLKNLQRDLSNAEKERAKYGGGLLEVLSLTQIATVENSMAFLDQKRLLLKHDIPYYDVFPASSTNREPNFKPTPGEDVDKF